MTAQLKSTLDKYIGHISQVNGVSQIYLFGSHALGTSDGKSDIDLLITVDDKLDPIKVAHKIQMDLSEMDTLSNASFEEILHEPALDIIVNRKTAFEKASKEHFFQREVIKTGVLLYGE